MLSGHTHGSASLLLLLLLKFKEDNSDYLS